MRRSPRKNCCCLPGTTCVRLPCHNGRNRRVRLTNHTNTRGCIGWCSTSHPYPYSVLYRIQLSCQGCLQSIPRSCRSSCRRSNPRITWKKGGSPTTCRTGRKQIYPHTSLPGLRRMSHSPLPCLSWAKFADLAQKPRPSIRLPCDRSTQSPTMFVAELGGHVFVDHHVSQYYFVSVVSVTSDATESLCVRFRLRIL